MSFDNKFKKHKVTNRQNYTIELLYKLRENASTIINCIEREQTTRIRERAENSVLIIRMLQGELSKELGVELYNDLTTWYISLEEAMILSIDQEYQLIKNCKPVIDNLIEAYEGVFSSEA